jgi:hypothetical protein
MHFDLFPSSQPIVFFHSGIGFKIGIFEHQIYRRVGLLIRHWTVRVYWRMVYQKIRETQLVIKDSAGPIRGLIVP